MRFAVIASPRTGSSHLTTLLNLQSDTLCNGEICHPKKVFVHWRRSDRTPDRLAELADLRKSDPKQFLDRIYEVNYDLKNVGFKILRGQDRRVFKTVIEDHDIRKVVLFRRNVLANYSSKLIANKTGKYALSMRRASNNPAKRPTVLFDPGEFLEFRYKYESYYASTINKMLRSGQEFHFINYEEINNRYFFVMLLAFIGADVRRAVFEGKHAKQNSSDIVSRFSNSVAVEAFLREQNLLHWSYEGQTCFAPGVSPVSSPRGGFDSPELTITSAAAIGH